MTSPSTSQPSAASPLACRSRRTSLTLHSIAARLSPTRGTLTCRLGTGVNPATSNSLMPCSTGADVLFIRSPSSFVTRFQTNSFVSLTFLTVFLVVHQLLEEFACHIVLHTVAVGYRLLVERPRFHFGL